MSISTSVLNQFYSSYLFKQNTNELFSDIDRNLFGWTQWPLKRYHAHHQLFRARPPLMANQIKWLD